MKIINEAVKKKQGSRKRKEHWRKHIDITDVEKFLDEQRQDERIGKVSDKTDDELYVIEKKVNKTSKLNARVVRLAKANRKPKCLLALENSSKVEDPIVKRNHVRTKEERKHFIAKSIEEKKRLNGIIPKRKQQSRADHKMSRINRRIKLKNNKRTRFEQDVWEMGDLKDQRTDFKNQWIDRNVAEHNLCNTGTPITSIPKTIQQKTSKLKSIPMPHPGTSYNPTLKDYQNLIETICDQETKIIETEAHLKRVTTDMFNKVTAEERDDQLRKEFENEIKLDETIDPNEKPDGNADADNDTYKAINPPVVVKRKDKKARKKKWEQNEIKQKLLKVKMEKKKVTDLHRLRHILKDVKDESKNFKKNNKLKKKRKELLKLEPKRLGKLKYTNEEIDFNTTENITGSLRSIKTEGSILTDRFKSLQKRNMLAPSKDIGLRKRRDFKRFARNTHKEEVKQPEKRLKKTK